MINRLGSVSIFVSDQDRAKAFYTEKLGMEVRSDNRLGPDSEARWLAVAPPGAETEITLYLHDGNWDHYEKVLGKSQAMTFNVEDVQATFETYKSRGVEFIQEPETQFWGTFAILKDSEGNQLILVQV